MPDCYRLNGHNVTKLGGPDDLGYELAGAAITMARVLNSSEVEFASGTRVRVDRVK